jgi:hypothetical protein
MSVMGGVRGVEFAVLEQEAFPATKVARDQEMSIRGVVFARSHDGTATAVSTRMSFNIKYQFKNVGSITTPTRFASDSRCTFTAYMLFIHRSART